MNTGQAPTNELVVRQAINQAVDKDTIIAKVLHGLEPRADALFSSNMPYANIGLKALPYDPDHARQALDAAGWKVPAGKTVREKDGQPLSTELVFLGTSAAKAWLKSFRVSWPRSASRSSYAPKKKAHWCSANAKAASA